MISYPKYKNVHLRVEPKVTFNKYLGSSKNWALTDQMNFWNTPNIY